MSRSELIFNQVNGSFVDGYGIRTTIFLKGCPLRCKWCCNPEGQLFTRQLRYHADDCTGCGRCTDRCPNGAITIQKSKAVIDRSRCRNCLACTDVCWMDALVPAAQPRTTEEIFEVLLREKPFFDRSGGGLTIGGGEATCFPQFCLELIDLCHGAGIPVNIDSCGYTVSEEAFRVLEAADLVLYDIKGIDPQLHRENTGADNALILENFHRLTAIGKPMIVRLPIIPGMNDSDAENRAKTALLAAAPNVERVDIIPFHTYGFIKYEELGMKCPMDPSLKPLQDADVMPLYDMLREAGLNVQIGG